MIDLPDQPILSDSERRRLEEEYERFRDGLPPDLHAHLIEAHGVDVAGEYAGRAIRNPFGKASGQLSLNARQVRRGAGGPLGVGGAKTGVPGGAGGGPGPAPRAAPPTPPRRRAATRRSRAD